MHVIPPEIREVLSSYSFIKNYMDGKISKEEFRENLKKYAEEFKSKGISREQILSLYNTDDPEDFHRKASYSRFCRFARKIGLDIATKQQKIDFIKSINSDKFLDILSISNSLLRDTFSFIRWRNHEEKTMTVGSMIFGTALEAPDNSSEEFRKLFYMMQQELSISNLDLWAIKIYFGIICAHIFPDANGRLARNTYFIFRSDGLIDEKKVIARPTNISKAIVDVNVSAISTIFKKEGIKIDKYLDDYAADEDYGGEGDVFVQRGLTQQLKFVAAKRVLIKSGNYNGQTLIGINNKCMSKDELANYKEEYQKVRLEWFWTCIGVSEKDYKQLMSLLDEAIIKT